MVRKPGNRESGVTSAHLKRRAVSSGSQGRSGGRGGCRAAGSPEVLEVVVVRLRVIGESTRVQIMELLDRCGSATVQEITDRLPGVCTRQNVSKHLGMLHAAGLLRRHRDGMFTRYELADWSALWLIEQVAESVQDQLDAQRATFARGHDPG